MNDQTPKGKPRHLTLSHLSEAKKLPIDFLRKIGLDDAPRGVAIKYLDGAGNDLFTKVRHKLNRDDPPGDIPLFSTAKGQASAIYGEWRLDRARREGRVILVE